MSKTMKYLDVGPGGIDCICCFPKPGSKEREHRFRKAKKRERREAMKEALEND